MKKTKLKFETIKKQIEESLALQVKHSNESKSHGKNFGKTRDRHDSLIENGGDPHDLSHAKSGMEISNRQFEKHLGLSKLATAASIRLSSIAMHMLGGFLNSRHEKILESAATATLPFCKSRDEARNQARLFSKVREMELSEIRLEIAVALGGHVVTERAGDDGGFNRLPFLHTYEPDEFGRVDVARMNRKLPETSVKGIEKVIELLGQAIKSGAEPIAFEVQQEERPEGPEELEPVQLVDT